RNLERPRLVFHQRSLRLELGEKLEAGLRLARFCRFGAEALDERHDVAPLRLTFLRELGIERLALLALAFERRVAAAVERKPPALEMKDVIDRLIEQVAIVADDDHGARIAREMILQPQCAF